MLNIIGIDVSKNSLDGYSLRDNVSWTLPYSPEDQETLSLKLADASLVIVEATGGYQQELVSFLHEHHIPVAVVNPRQVRHFAKASGLLAKTDKLDAKVLALFGQAFQPASSLPNDSSTETLKALVHYRDDLLKFQTAQKNRLKQLKDSLVQDSLLRSLAHLKQEITLLNQQIKCCIRQSKSLRDKTALLTSVKGVGTVLAATLLGDLPQLGLIEHKPAAALAGLAPFNCDSGRYRGRRKIWGGRSAVRKNLYLAANIARRYDPTMKAFYDKLRLAGKPFKVAIIACARKLLIILNAKMRDFLQAT